MGKWQTSPPDNYTSSEGMELVIWRTIDDRAWIGSWGRLTWFELGCPGAKTDPNPKNWSESLSYFSSDSYSISCIRSWLSRNENWSAGSITEDDYRNVGCSLAAFFGFTHVLNFMGAFHLTEMSVCQMERNFPPDWNYLVPFLLGHISRQDLKWRTCGHYSWLLSHKMIPIYSAICWRTVMKWLS